MKIRLSLNRPSAASFTHHTTRIIIIIVYIEPRLHNRAISSTSSFRRHRSRSLYNIMYWVIHHIWRIRLISLKTIFENIIVFSRHSRYKNQFLEKKKNYISNIFHRCRFTVLKHNIYIFHFIFQSKVYKRLLKFKINWVVHSALLSL